MLKLEANIQFLYNLVPEFKWNLDYFRNSSLPKLLQLQWVQFNSASLSIKMQFFISATSTSLNLLLVTVFPA